MLSGAALSSYDDVESDDAYADAFDHGFDDVDYAAAQAKQLTARQLTARQLEATQFAQSRGRNRSVASASAAATIITARELATAAAAPAAPAPATPTPATDSPVETVRDLQARIRQMQGTKLDTRSLPTHPAIASLLPGGGLQQGAAYSVASSATLLMALLAGPSAAGSWCGVVGVPEFGVEAASHYGVDLERLVLVPHPGDQWLAVTAAIADVLTVVVTRPPRRATDSNVARLAARLRQRGATLIVLGSWPQTDAMLSLSHSRWSGIGDGSGHLAAREVTVTVSTRAGARPRSARLWLPDRGSSISRAETGGPERLPQHTAPQHPASALEPAPVHHLAELAG
ncbi:hypothetical protein [Marisediminicola sp. LYQ134]|uniref:hypothetical protein n=1 Tax=Marisediminicola sp. LYQ134 TaxID=3391061 RepID=UPI003983AA7F